MAKLQVLVDKQGHVLGTLVVAAGTGTAPPEQYGFNVTDGQRTIEITAGDDLAGLSAAALHEKIEAEHLAAR